MNSSFTSRRLVRRLSFVLLGLLLVTGSAFAQISTGSITGKVVDNDGNGLPGVTVTLTGGGAPQVAISESDGTFRYPSLTPGRYDLKAELSGMGVSTTPVEVNIGRNSSVTMKLAPTIQQTITVTAETPLLDTRKTGTGATVTKVELEEIPTARDPWVILQQVPGVLTDRINVGGNESGQQSSFVGKGSGGDQATFNVDGVNITDMSALGSSPAYYDFDSFEEIQVATGGTDPRIQTAGVQLNMVYKRGTNDFRGSGRYFHTNGEESKVSEEAKPYLNFFNAIDSVDDYGLELGGPVIKDRLWLWGAYGRNQIDLFVAQPTTAQLPLGASDPNVGVRFTDKTKLETINAKVNGQITTNNSAVLLYTDSGKTKFGRNASPTRPPETTWNQDKYGPKGNYKLEDTHIFSSNFYLTGMYSKTNGGFQLVPNSGQNCTDLACTQGPSVKNAVQDAATGIWSRSFVYAFIKRPQTQYRADGSAFFETGSLNHELKFGAGFREVKQQTISNWPQSQFYEDFTNLGAPDCCGVYFFRPAFSDTKGTYNDLYVGDTLLLGNLTIQGGLRWDSQKGHANALSTTANPDVPNLLPAVSLNVPDEIEWTSVSPRIGFTYTLGSSRRTVIRGGYNRYVDQLGTGTMGLANPLSAYQYLYYYNVTDANHDKHITGAELAASLLNGAYFYGSYHLDPNDPLHTKQLNRFDNDMNPPHTDEYVIGFEHELMSDFTVGANYTHRNLDDFVGTRYEKTQGKGDWYSPSDYTLLGNATGFYPPCTVNTDPTKGKVGNVLAGGCKGPAFSTPVYVLKPGISTPTFGVVTNLPDYSQKYEGIEVTAVKRMSHHWMFRGNFSWNDWTQQVGAGAITDPTLLRTTTGCNNCDGSAVVQGSGTGSGAKGGVYINSKWSYNLTGVVQLPWQFSLGASAIGRQGYPIPYVSRVFTGANTVGGEGFKQVLVADVDQFRLDDVFNLDLRLAKDFRFNQVGLTLSVDAFNVTDERTVLQRNTRLFRSRTGINAAANRITEAQAPRVFRLGARLTF
jgi:carboxypeptidase family protein/TonB-dependent receptor-like protein